MKRLFFAVMLLASIAIPAAAQTPTVTTPQSVTSSNFFNAVTTPQTSSNFTNVGQTVHLLFYQATGVTANPTGVLIRLEGSFDGITYFPISDDGTDPGQGGSNIVIAIGTYPFIHANLVNCTSCSAASSVTASYTGSSSIPGNVFGKYGAGQQIRKVGFLNASAGGSGSPFFVTPYGSTSGFLLLATTNGSFTSGTVSARCLDSASVANAVTLVLPSTTLLALPVSATPCNLVNIRCTGCAVNAGAGTFTIFWFFYPPGQTLPGGAQPANTSNSEATSAANSSVATTLTVNGLQRGHLFKVNARCSAGTAQLTVADGSTQIYSTAATEVGTTSFKDSWPVGLASSPNNNLVITLGTCGAANTGTLDVQGSVF